MAIMDLDSLEFEFLISVGELRDRAAGKLEGFLLGILCFWRKIFSRSGVL